GVGGSPPCLSLVTEWRIFIVPETDGPATTRRTSGLFIAAGFRYFSLSRWPVAAPFIRGRLHARVVSGRSRCHDSGAATPHRGCELPLPRARRPGYSRCRVRPPDARAGGTGSRASGPGDSRFPDAARRTCTAGALCAGDASDADAVAGQRVRGWRGARFRSSHPRKARAWSPAVLGRTEAG